mgnify:CR=1 FL=1
MTKKRVECGGVEPHTTTDFFLIAIEKILYWEHARRTRRNGLIIPLKDLIREVGNMYALTCAAIKRVMQLSVSGDEEMAKNHGKIVSVAIKQILEKKIEYKLEE